MPLLAKTTNYNGLEVLAQTLKPSFCSGLMSRLKSKIPALPGPRPTKPSCKTQEETQK